ncbi:PLP-dependent transferase [Salix suchowensis]|nr:PLP-dependent transferase [Salix suchowensis]
MAPALVHAEETSELESGQTVIDAVGGAAVACIGNGHPVVKQAIKDQRLTLSLDVYNMQLSNEPAEALAKYLVETSNGAFEMVGFVSGVLPRNRSATTQELHCASIVVPRKYSRDSIFSVSPYSQGAPAYAARFKKSGETDGQYVDRLRQELDDKFVELGPDTVIGCRGRSCRRDRSGRNHRGSRCTGRLFQGHEIGVRQIWRLVHPRRSMGSTHAWETLGDGIAPDIQAVAKGLGGGYDICSSCNAPMPIQFRRYASIGAVLISKKVAEGIRGKSGLWKHGHTYQAHPLACAASLAVQQVIKSENLLENIRTQGAYLDKLLNDRLRGPNSLAAPFTFDIRGAGGSGGWNLTSKCPRARALKNGLVIMGFGGGSNLEATKGDHLILAPAYNVTKEEIEIIVDIFMHSVEEVISEYSTA